MANKLEVLETVRNTIEASGTIRYQYTNGNCMCAVGYIMNECGVNMDLLFTGDEALNSKSIDRILEEDIMGPLEDVGFNEEELARLQRINDSASNLDERRAEVLQYIDRMIEDIKEFIKGAETEK
jgi:hypothetical protein